MQRFRLFSICLLGLLVASVASIVLGCAVTMNPDGLHAVFGGTYYGTAGEKPCGCGDGDTTNVQNRRHTYAARTWGTSALKGEVKNDSEKISIQGEGMSVILGETLGKDIVRDAVAAALKVTPIGAGLAAGKFVLGDDEEVPVDVTPLERLEPRPIE